MSRRRTPAAIALVPLAIAGLALGPAAARAAAPDPYAPLQLYQGRWLVRESDGKTRRLENHCARTGLFYSCEQVVDGKTGALVVFAPQPAAPGTAGLSYRTMGLNAAFPPAGPWGYLTIDGPQWTFTTADPADGATPLRQRILNRFTGTDHIHAEGQASADGKTWKTTFSVDEQRLP